MSFTITATMLLTSCGSSATDPARVLPGFDYDVTSTDGLLHGLSVTSGILRTSAGISYRALALPRSHILPLAALEVAQHYVEAGGILSAPRPLRSQGVVTESEASKFSQIVDALWNACEKSRRSSRHCRQGPTFCTDSSRDALEDEPPFSRFRGTPHMRLLRLDYIPPSLRGN